MPNAGDNYIVMLEEAHIMWGEYHPSRHSHSRGEVYGEGYIKIPANDAYNYGIFNKNNPFGANVRYNCKSYDGYYSGRLLSQGNQSDANYAKQFAEEGNLKGIGDWYDFVGATAGDYVKVVFTSPTDIVIEHSHTRTGFHI
jgi:hypothetical protein